MRKLNGQIAEYKKDPNSAALSSIQNEEELGVLASGSSYDAVVRFSNGHPGNRPDKLPDARGFEVKILPKETLEKAPIKEMNAEELNFATKLDILSINFPTFFVNDPIKYTKLNRVFLDSALDFKNKILSQAEGFWSIFVSADLTSLERKLALLTNGSVIYSPLYQEYFSMVPSRLGLEGSIRAVKYSWQPLACSADVVSEFNQEKKKQWAEWTNDHTYAFPPHQPSVISKHTSPYSEADFPDDYLRGHVTDRLVSGDFCFQLYLQLYRDQVSTNIEDSTDLWPRSETEKKWWIDKVVPGEFMWKTDFNNSESRNAYLQRFRQKQIAPPILAAKLMILKINADESMGAADNNKTCEDLSFSPWNGDIAYHKPLGIVSRMRRKIYNASRRTRHKLNGIDDKNRERP